MQPLPTPAMLMSTVSRPTSMHILLTQTHWTWAFTHQTQQKELIGLIRGLGEVQPGMAPMRLTIRIVRVNAEIVNEAQLKNDRSTRHLIHVILLRGPECALTALSTLHLRVNVLCPADTSRLRHRRPQAIQVRQKALTTKPISTHLPRSAITTAPHTRWIRQPHHRPPRPTIDRSGNTKADAHSRRLRFPRPRTVPATRYRGTCHQPRSTRVARKSDSRNPAQPTIQPHNEPTSPEATR